MKKHFVAILLAYLGSPLPAWSAPREALDIRSIRNCTTQQEDTLKAAEAGLAERLSQLKGELPRYDLEYVRLNFIAPNGREWLIGSPRNHAYERYLRTITEVFASMESDTRSGLNMECKDSLRERHCQGGQVYAYVLFLFGRPQKTLYFCSSFFGLPQDQQRATLIHELSHYSASTDDLALSWMDLKRPDLSQAPRDAYHIEQFSDDDPATTLKRQIWLWNWPKRD